MANFEFKINKKDFDVLKAIELDHQRKRVDTSEEAYRAATDLPSRLEWLNAKLKELMRERLDYEVGSERRENLNSVIHHLRFLGREAEKLDPEAAEYLLQLRVDEFLLKQRLRERFPDGERKYREHRRKEMKEINDRMEANADKLSAEVGFNRHWFREQLASRNMSQRFFAEFLKIDPSAVSYMLSGRRKVTLEEAKKIADLFGVNTTEVMRQAGVLVTDDSRPLPLRGFTSNGQIEWLEGEQKTVHGPFDAGRKDYVIQNRTGMGPSDGWLYFVDGERMDPALGLERLCVLKLGSGEEILGIVKKGYSEGVYNVLLGPDLKKTLHEQTVEYVSPIKWIKPGNIIWLQSDRPRGSAKKS